MRPAAKSLMEKSSARTCVSCLKSSASKPGPPRSVPASRPAIAYWPTHSRRMNAYCDGGSRVARSASRSFRVSWPTSTRPCRPSGLSSFGPMASSSLFAKPTSSTSSPSATPPSATPLDSVRVDAQKNVWLSRARRLPSVTRRFASSA